MSSYDVRIHIKETECDYLRWIQWEHNSVPTFVNTTDIERNGFFHPLTPTNAQNVYKVTNHPYA
jgi:hypothetical protein